MSVPCEESAGNMAGISTEQLQADIAAILSSADLNSITTKKVRQQLEAKYSTDLIGRKKEIDDLVMSYLDEKHDGHNLSDDEDERKGLKRGKKASSEESEDESEVVQDLGQMRQWPQYPTYNMGKGSDEDYSPLGKKGAKKQRKGKKGSESEDSDDDWNASRRAAPPPPVAKPPSVAPPKRGGAAGGKRETGYTRTCKLSPELADVVGTEYMARHEVVKKIWSIIKERNLYDPKNKQFAICDDQLLKVFGVKRFRTFGMMKYLKSHFVE